jgi:hypothetical protein
MNGHGGIGNWEVPSLESCKLSRTMVFGAVGGFQERVPKIIAKFCAKNPFIFFFFLPIEFANYPESVSLRRFSGGGIPKADLAHFTELKTFPFYEEYRQYQADNRGCGGREFLQRRL